MVKFQCDGKRMIGKTVFFLFRVEMSKFFAKILARFMLLMSKTCRLCN